MDDLDDLDVIDFDKGHVVSELINYSQNQNEVI